MMACGNIIKEDQEFGNVESQKSPLLLFLVVCPLFASVAAKKILKGEWSVYQQNKWL